MSGKGCIIDATSEEAFRRSHPVIIPRLLIEVYWQTDQWSDRRSDARVRGLSISNPPESLLISRSLKNSSQPFVLSMGGEQHQLLIFSRGDRADMPLQTRQATVPMGSVR